MWTAPRTSGAGRPLPCLHAACWVAAVVAAVVVGALNFVPVLAIIAVLVLWLHRENIARLKAGSEPRIGGKK